MQSHYFNQHRHQSIHESIFLIQESIRVAYGSPQNTTDHVSGFHVRGQLPVRDRKSYRTQVVGNHAHSHVRRTVLSVFFAAQPGYLPDNRGKYIGIVIGRFPLYRHAQTFEAHPRIHVMARQVLQTAIRFPVILHKHKIPYLDHQRIILVNQVTSRLNLAFFVRAQINMYLGTGTAGSHFPHFPEIIFFIPVQYLFLGQILQPILQGFIIRVKMILLVPLENRGVQSVFIQLHLFRQKLPRVSYCLFLEIIPE